MRDQVLSHIMNGVDARPFGSGDLYRNSNEDLASNTFTLMKPILRILVAILAIPFVLQAQSIDRYTINTSGATLTNNDLYLSVTLGQSGLVGLLEGDQLFLQAGFQQVDFVEVTSLKPTAGSIKLSIFPNPFVHTFHISVEMDEEIWISIDISNSIGQRILTEETKLPAGINRIPIDLSSEAPGFYIVQVTMRTQTGNLNYASAQVIHSQ